MLSRFLRSSQRLIAVTAVLLTACLAFGAASEAQSFVNWESPHVSPLDLTPDGSMLLAVNTADNRLEVFDLGSGAPTLKKSIFVGLDPVSVRARTVTEAWVVNQVSDSVSVVDLGSGLVTATLQTLDEPADVVFAGDPQKAFVSCSQANTLQVFDPQNLDAAPTAIPLEAEDPRAMSVAADGSEIYVAIFQSGNHTTALRGRLVVHGEEVTPLNHPSGPYGGLNPPPNDGDAFKPAIRTEYLPDGAEPAPEVSLIVQKFGDSWFDDNGTDWTSFVSGDFAPVGLRPVGWELHDRDVAVIDAETLSVTWIGGLMTTDMAIATHPISGEVTVVGTEAQNLTRFEPNLKSRFIQSVFASVGESDATVVDLNAGHLTYTDAQINAQAQSGTADTGLRDLSIGDPRGIAWRADGETGFVTGMGSDHVVPITSQGARPADSSPIEVGQGPTGLVVDESRFRLYVLNKFDASISVVSLTTMTETQQVHFFDPSPQVIKDGRPFLYNTQLTSGLGQASCASCHIDARMDRLAWDLGDPSGAMKAVDGESGKHNLAMDVPGLNTNFLDFHPMKGPMVTQTLVDIIGKEPLHWRGDRDHLEEFNGAFLSLLGDDRQLTSDEMAKLKAFLATLHFPPNPFRDLENGLPTSVPLPGHYSDGRYAAQGGLSAGEPMPAGNAQRGLDFFRPPNVTAFGGLACSSCHTMPTGAGSDHQVNASQTAFEPIPAGANGENHLAIFIEDGTVESTIKAPQLRNMHEKTGFQTTTTSSWQGFGYEHDGVTDTLTRFHMHPTFFLEDDQAVADMVAFMMSFSGSDLPNGSTDYGQFLIFEPPGPSSQDTHAAVGRQLTVDAANKGTQDVLDTLTAFRALADVGAVGLVAKGLKTDESRGYVYAGGGSLQSDRDTETVTLDGLRAGLTGDERITFSLVPYGSETRIGIDRDEDGAWDRDELDACSDPANAASLPVPGVTCTLFADGFESGNADAWSTATGLRSGLRSKRVITEGYEP